MSYSLGLHEVGDGLYAYLQPDGGWGWSNAGLIVDGESTLLVDTLYDLALTKQMLQTMRRAVSAAARIDTLVNTHANGDHCYGNQLVGGARIVASERTATEMSELSMRVGELELIEVGPAHTRGDTLVHVPARRVLFSGDILFSGAHPIAWAGPVSNWIAACDRILAMDVEVIVPGHGPLAGPAAVSELKAYFEYLYEQARACHAEGMTALEAARAISLERWVDWRERERLVVNIANIYAELDGDQEPMNPLAAFEGMAELARSR